MNNLIRLNVILLVIFIIYFHQSAAAADQILPIPKPTVDEETFKYFYSKNMYLDNHRKENFLDVVPEYTKFLERYISDKYKEEPYGPTNSIPMVLIDE